MYWILKLLKIVSFLDHYIKYLKVQNCSKTKVYIDKTKIKQAPQAPTNVLKTSKAK